MGKPANDNLQRAFTIAKNEFGITPLLDPEGKFYFVHLVILRIHVMLFFFAMIGNYMEPLYFYVCQFTQYSFILHVREIFRKIYIVSAPQISKMENFAGMVNVL